MKNLVLLALLFSVSTLFAQKFTIKSDNGNVFYLDQSHTIKVKVEGYDSSKTMATASKVGIMTGQDGKYTVNLSLGHLNQRNVDDSVLISVFIKKEDGNHLLGNKTFYIARKNDFEMGFDNFRAGDNLSISQFTGIETMGIAFDDEWTLQNGKGYKVLGYNCLVVPKMGNAEAFACSGNKLSLQIKESVKRMGFNTRVIFDDIVLQNEAGDKKRGSRIFLTIFEDRGTSLYPFSEKDSYTIDELLNINTLTARVGSDSPLAGTVYEISSYEVLLVPKVGLSGAFMSNSNQLSDDIKSNIKQTLKPGDKILFDNITYIRPDGTYGRCYPVRIFVK